MVYTEDPLQLTDVMYRHLYHVYTQRYAFCHLRLWSSAYTSDYNKHNSRYICSLRAYDPVLEPFFDLAASRYEQTDSSRDQRHENKPKQYADFPVPTSRQGECIATRPG